MKVLFNIILLFFVPILLFAQHSEHKHDSIVRDTLYTRFAYLSPNFFLTSEPIEYKHDLCSFVGFDPLEKNVWSARVGALGSAYQLQWFPEFIATRTANSFDFLYVPNEYLFTYENIPIFRDTMPFSIASYSSGHKKEQFFNFSHSQPLAKRWQLNLDYRIINAPGAYQNQKNKQSGFFSNVSYSNQKGNYILNFGLILNNIVQHENGGVKSVSEFLDTTIYARNLSEVNLHSAQNQNRFNNYYISNEFQFLKDKNGDNSLFINHSFIYKRHKHIYKDDFMTDSLFFSVWNTQKSYDSIFDRAFENTVLFGKKTGKTRWSFGVNNSANRLYNTGLDTFLTQTNIVFNFAYWIKSRYIISSNVSIEVLPYSDGNRFYMVEFNSSDTLLWQPFAHFSYTENTCQIFYNRYMGNHFSWIAKEWKSKKTFLFFAGILYKNLSVSLFYSDFSNHLSWRTVGFNQDCNGSAFGSKLSANTSFGRFQLKGLIGLQQIRGTQYMNLPPWFAKAEISMRNSIFKKALTLQSGFGAWINASYFADAYNPALQIFYAQREIKTGGFVYPTLFVRAQIKRAIVFVELINFTAGFIGVNYWQIPYYPLADRSFRFGISWNFLK